jgi:hypothetical protein
VRPACDDERRHAPHPCEWLLIEWPQGEPEPILALDLPKNIAFRRLVDLAKNQPDRRSRARLIEITGATEAGVNRGKFALIVSAT